MAYYVYLLKCSDDTYYCGYTTDIEKRVNAHNQGKTGAKYTKNRRPVKLKYFEKYLSLSDALKREHAIKKLTRKEKAALIK
jgi:putative endonuclease